uniref:glucuronate isomerase n=1 Tax=Bacillus sp. WP8 TaxID=756828 RepID=UPI00119F1888
TPYFNVNHFFSQKNPHKLCHISNHTLNQTNISTNPILQKFNLKLLSTTHHPIHTLQIHQIIPKHLPITTTLLPTFTPDQPLNIQQ